MKIKNGKIRNLNKKLIAGALTFVLITVPLTGCDARTVLDDNISYETNESGYISGITGTVSYEFLKNCRFCKVENKITEETYYTIGFNVRTYRWIEGYDIFTKQDFSKGRYGLEIVDSVVLWLENLNKAKTEYTEEELREVLNIFIEKQEAKSKK